ncbi:thiol reductant ABC exporter subunit CydC [Litchfieldella qijiaojingensis]|uniref:Thiol reductant ABC exporter subunit CydC n=1 Tax=Litchfieldella qijiaojingensis TaxID=980347 RepID=A0ABQ2YD47_9GAMM|nr:thiol reductant ABC exporter subunit CydC [Halomonas qijiaojingensis]GGX79945.1 thiol reductant ABC exporter subunit CydC [Halomonas qijiaojingensis]
MTPGDRRGGSAWRELGNELCPWLRQLGQRRRRLVLGALLLASTVGAAIGLLALSGWFITATALTGTLLAAGAVARLDVYVPGGGIRFFALTRTVSRYVERLYNHDTVLRLLADLRAVMFRVLAGLDAQALSRRRASEWLNRLTADIDTLDSLYLRLLAPPAVALLAILVVVVLLASFTPLVGGIIGLVLMALWGWLVVGQAWLGMSPSQRRVATLDRLRGHVIEHLQGLGELRAYGSLSMHRRRIFDEEDALYRDQRQLGRITALGNALAGLGVSLVMLLVLWLAALAYRAEALSGPLMVMMPLAVLALNEAFAVLPAAFTQLGATRAAARRLNALKGSSSAIVETATASSIHEGAVELRLEAASLHYPDSLSPALDEISLTLGRGERVALLGASGAGKSSVAMLLTRLQDPSRGRVTLNGVDLRELSLEALRSRIACLTQSTELFHDSIAVNLRLARPEASDAELWRVLEAVELADWAERLPRQLETPVGEGGRQLSGGQARRLGLARVLLRESPVVILDEPFSGLDRPLAERIAARLDAWLAGKTVLFLVHQLGNGQVAPPGIRRSLKLVQGRIAS